MTPEALLQEIKSNSSSTPGEKSRGNLVLVDGTLPNPTQKDSGAKSPQEGFLQEHLPGAVFLDLDGISDADFAPGVGHNLPTDEVFTRTMKELGVSPDSQIVTYDQAGMFSAPRAWFTFKAFGVPNVRVLAGGLPAWKRLGFPTESGPAKKINPNHDDTGSTSTGFTKVAGRQWGLEDMRANVGKEERDRVQVVDARSAGRFKGEEPEPRAGSRGGHIPGSLSLPFSSLLKEHESGSGMTQVDVEELRDIVAKAQVDLEKPTVATCGSGLTAAHLALALYRLGVEDVAIYDGRYVLLSIESKLGLNVKEELYVYVREKVYTE